MSQFAINSVQVGNGIVALSPLPGGSGKYDGDMDALRKWQPDLVISLTTDLEMLQVGASNLGSDLRTEGIEWVHLPIEDFSAPSPAINAAWTEVSATAADILARGGRVLAHCRGGCGRSGMIVLRLMVEHGEHPTAALQRLRAVRPCAVETTGQLDWAARPQQPS